MIRELNLILLQGTQGDLDEVRVADLEAGIDRIDEMLLPLAYGPQRHGHRLRLDKNQMEDQAVILGRRAGPALGVLGRWEIGFIHSIGRSVQPWVQAFAGDIEKQQFLQDILFW